MEKWKKLGKALLFPPMAVLWLLLPAAIAGLVYGLAVLDRTHPAAIAFYVLSAYTLTVWCCRVPAIIASLQHIKRSNRYVLRWTSDARLRMRLSLLGGCAWNAVYAVFQLVLGIYHRTFWYGSLAGYYFLLALMRFPLARYAGTHAPGEDVTAELRHYRRCGVVFLFMNLALTLITFFMVYWGRSFRHHQITTIAMAAYTFTSFAVAIVNTAKSRSLGSPVCDASRAISLAAASVSMLTLSSTMLTVFGQDSSPLLRRVLLISLGGAVSLFIVTMAVYMLVSATKKLKARN